MLNRNLPIWLSKRVENDKCYCLCIFSYTAIGLLKCVNFKHNFDCFLYSGTHTAYNPLLRPTFYALTCPICCKFIVQNKGLPFMHQRTVNTSQNTGPLFMHQPIQSMLQHIPFILQLIPIILLHILCML